MHVYSLFADDVSADEDVVFVPGGSAIVDENEDSLGTSYQDEEVNSDGTSDSEGVVVSSGGIKSLPKLPVKSPQFCSHVTCFGKLHMLQFQVRIARVNPQSLTSATLLLTLIRRK